MHCGQSEEMVLVDLDTFEKGFLEEARPRGGSGNTTLRNGLGFPREKKSGFEGSLFEVRQRHKAGNYTVYSGYRSGPTNKM